jgi:hypothetical protein
LYAEKIKYVRPEIEKDLDLVRYIQRIRMHGLALRLLMNEDHKRISGWLGYRRDIEHINDTELEDHVLGQDCWNQADGLSNAEKVFVGKIKA